MPAKRKYNWEEWFGRTRTILRRGVDYRCSQSAMSQMIRNAASARGLHVKIDDCGDGLVIEVKNGIPYTNQTTVATKPAGSLAQVDKTKN